MRKIKSPITTNEAIFEICGKLNEIIEEINKISVDFDETIKEELNKKLPEILPTVYVHSFNGKSGSVQGVESFNARKGAVTLENSDLQNLRIVTSVNGKTGDVTVEGGETDAYTPENPPPYPVRSVNNQTGDINIPVVINAYSPNNPPPYPVRSVNNQTGDVIISVPSSDAYSPSNPPPYPVNSVNNKSGNVVIGIDDIANLQTQLNRKYSPDNLPPVTSVNGQTGATGNLIDYDENYTLYRISSTFGIIMGYVDTVTDTGGYFVVNIPKSCIFGMVTYISNEIDTSRGSYTGSQGFTGNRIYGNAYLHIDNEPIESESIRIGYIGFCSL